MDAHADSSVPVSMIVTVRNDRARLAELLRWRGLTWRYGRDFGASRWCVAHRHGLPIRAGRSGRAVADKRGDDEGRGTTCSHT